MIALIGKLPAHGDFIRRGDATGVMDAIDGWLEAAFAAMPELADRIDALDGWGFAIRIDGQAVTGVIVASRDRAGRRFPLIGLWVGDGAAATRNWMTAAAALMARARDTGLTADQTVAGLTTLEPAGAAAATGWSRIDGEGMLPIPALPTGADFARLFARDAG